MSSYLNIYLVPKRKDKDKEKQYLLLTSYSRSTDLYSSFNENINIAYAGNEDKYTVLNLDSIQVVIDDIEAEVNNCKERVSNYERYANGNTECIETIIDLNEHIQSLKAVLSIAVFIKGIIEDTADGFNNFEEVCCNIS